MEGRETKTDNNNNYTTKIQLDGCAASMNPQRASTANELHLIF